MLRLPTLERNFWQLASGEKANAEHSDTFWIPEKERRDNLQRGDAVRECDGVRLRWSGHRR